MFLANLLIALRESVEAALVVGILIAYLVRTGRSSVLPRLWAGVVIGVVVPLGIGALLTWGPYTLSERGEEVLDGVLSVVAVGLVTWMIFWMGAHSREYAARLRDGAGAAVDSGSVWGVVWIAVVAVGREGIETALFAWASVRSAAATSAWGPALGVLAGLALGVLVGWVVYSGAARISLHRFFTVTGVLLVVVAAGLLAGGVGALQEAHLLPGGAPLYDLSGWFDGSLAPWLTTSAWWFTLLHAVVGLDIAPSALQVAVWVVYLVGVLTLFLRAGSAPRVSPTRAATPGVAATGGETAS